MDDDPLISVLPIRYNNSLSPHIQIHQFPLLTRPLQAPPSAASSGRRIHARLKPRSARLEVHLPVDNRPEVWNTERSKEFGAARAEDDQDHSHELKKTKSRDGVEQRLGEVRMRSERIPEKSIYMLGIVHDGDLHLHPISETHQFRPTLTYLDVMSRKQTRRSKTGAGDGSDSDSDDGPPPDPDDPIPQPTSKREREKKSTGDVKEVQVAVRKSEEKGPQSLQGGLSGIRREMLLAIRAEEEEEWEDIEYFDGEALESGEVYEAVFSRNEGNLECTTQLLELLKETSLP